MQTLGCRLNEAELGQWGRQFRDSGHAVVADAQAADALVVNTCAVTMEGARKSRKLIRSLHRENPTAKMIVTGCYAQLHGDEVAGMEGVDLVVSNRDKDRLPQIVADKLDLATMPQLATEPDGVPFAHKRRTRAFIKVQDGCRNRCTFCIVTVARGRERSRSIADICAEIEVLQDQGVQEAVLTGVHLGGYGSDLGTDLSTLTRAVLERTEIPRIRLSSLEPWDLPQDFWTLWQNPRLMPHVHLPAQSGSDSVLKRMARRNRVGEFRDLVARGRELIPGLSITTDIIVGFPGETDKEFDETLRFIEATRFSHIHTFAYSPRQGTKAATLPEPVEPVLLRQRSAQVRALAHEHKQRFRKAHIGQRRPILWEQKQADHWLGYTDNYLRVRCTSDDALINRITNPRLVAVGEEVLVAQHEA